MEVRYLANRDDQLQFALLSDFTDASEATLPGDAALLERACDGVAALNLRYPAAHGSGFFLFHRERSWNPGESRWMGEERKRGKLAELNALLRGRPCAAFSRTVGDLTGLDAVRYVITLDSDTRLPRDAASQFVGAMAHPLNRPYFDPVLQRVTEGYGILQPRVALSLPSTQRSRFARLFGSESGIDPYTRAISDVYQDLCGEGSFIGKGIYDVDAFEQALARRLPRNRILSHDLLEGCYTRAGLLSDVLLVEDFPSTYARDTVRRRRWIRGDWQIASWILWHVPGTRTDPDHGRQRNALSLLSRWKIFDNLRRSLVAPMLVALLVMGWWLMPVAPVTTAFVLAILLVPVLIATLVDLVRKPHDLTVGRHVLATVQLGRDRVLQAAFQLSCLLYEAGVSLDAVLRTSWRVLVSRRHLLEWQVTNHADGADGHPFAGDWRAMWPAFAAALLLLVALVLQVPDALPMAAPILALWLLAPWICFALSLPRQGQRAGLVQEQLDFLGSTARRTWLFFETFVGPADHWLPPDNFQEYPNPVVAHRTSPTNIGLALLANLAAHDLGYVSTGILVERTRATLTTMGQLARHQGHFFNWYDTLTLQPLPPLYVSTVDSGNLAAHLLTLQCGLLEFADRSILSGRWREGLHDALHAFEDAAGDLSGAPAAALTRVRRDLAALDAVGSDAVFPLQAALVNLLDSTSSLASALATTDAVAAPGSAQSWSAALERQVRGVLGELTLLAPWTVRQPLPHALAERLAEVSVPTLREVALGSCLDSIMAVAATGEEEDSRAWNSWLALVQVDTRMAAERAATRLEELAELAGVARGMAALDYDFLYDRTRHLLAIGYNVAERRRDQSYYDMLASEARLGSFVAIAQGQLPQSHWFALGRLLTRGAGKTVLLSWSGSMFEYLMPLLVMPNYDETLLDATYRAAVECQIQYGESRGVAWGVSESGYNAVDTALNYQYRAFGVPGMGLKPGLADDLVVAPYASALALMVAPDRACRNLQRLATEGASAVFGFYEAIDFTAARLPRRQASTLVRSFMAHHQGMILLSLDYLLAGQPMQRRFGADPMVQATSLLLQERVPRTGVLDLESGSFSPARPEAYAGGSAVQVIPTPWTIAPAVQLLSNGHYHVMVTNAGGGYSRWRDLAITRWREDPTRDHWGSFCYLRDVDSGVFWSNMHQPTLRPADRYEAIFSEGRAEFRRRDLDYEMHTEIVVSPEDDIELRRVHITNSARIRRTIEVTSYSEVVLASPTADAQHPAFGKLFVQTELDLPRGAILCTRRPRSLNETVAWMLHLVSVRGRTSEPSFETDRARFIGRGRSLVNPQALGDCVRLSGSAGSVLDPIAAIRHRIVLEPQQSVTIDFVTGAAATREAAVSLASKYQDRNLADRVFDLAWSHSQVVLRQINASEADAQLYRRIAAAVLYADPALRADPATLARNRRGQSGLWGYSISGDLPMVLVQIGDPANIELVRQLVQAHAYWRLKGLAVDLVIWNEDQAGYRQQLQEQILGLIAAGAEAHVVDKPGGIFVRRSEQMSDDERNLIESVARAIITDRRGTLPEQLARRKAGDARAQYADLPRFQVTRAHRSEPGGTDALLSHRDLLFDNGMGGFLADGSEYVISPPAATLTPAPWCNVIANAEFGTVVSESGSACTWSENAQEFRLSPWGNDPTTDAGGEVIYVRDEESGHFWTATALPSPGQGRYVTRHGFGYSCFEHLEAGIFTELTVFVALEGAVKFSLLKVRNVSGRPRRISATAYVEWVLGDTRPKTAMHLVSEILVPDGALIGRNAYNSDFPERVAFLDVNDLGRSYTGDRTEFIGRNHTLRNPAAMSRSRLSNTAGAGYDPCAAVQVVAELADAGEQQWSFRLGCGRDLGEAQALLERTRGLAAAQVALSAVRAYWRESLGVIQVETPDPALDLLANGWLVYQTQACRLWGRSAFYQSGGAFGFRDQLQDVMALMHAQPALAREHLLLCAGRQFREGDAQHWWHPTSGRGVRTRCSDDYLWLALATCRYVELTGDVGVLDVTAGFLEGRPVAAGEESYFDLPGHSAGFGTLYEHCRQAVLHGLRFGVHGLPLMGSGDWNDGMNMVGSGGQGESVWLGFFLCHVLTEFGNLARRHDDPAFADRCRLAREELVACIEVNGWDGDWYRRAYFDDGTPLGSASNAECQIDSVSQSWSVLSGVGTRERSRRGMEALDRRLVRRDDGLIALLTPPFDTDAMDPGYIKGYVPGVRENGGQYTHAAIWAVMAFAELGDSARAWELFRMINPVNHAGSPAAVARYKVEPYVVAADVYAVAPHIGRGGWTWYTGSAGWFYRLIIESLLGIQRRDHELHIAPCLPREWTSFRLRYRFHDTCYRIEVTQVPGPVASCSIRMDGQALPDASIPLDNNGGERRVEVHLQIPPGVV
jgi:cellobiose phosphorylase